MNRAASSFLLCLACAGCGAGASEPRLERFTPGSVSAAALPVVATVQGAHLAPSLSIRLDDDSQATDWPVRATLGTQPLSELQIASETELRVTVPKGLAPGVYDFELELGPGRRASLPEALRISAGGGWVPDGGTAVASACAASAFGAAKPVAIAGMAGRYIWSPTLSADFHTIYFAVTTLANPNTAEIWSATRPDRGSSFDAAAPLPDLSGTTDNSTPFPSADGLSLYFAGGGVGLGAPRDLYVATRADPGAPFGNARALVELDTPAMEQLPWVSPDELVIVFLSQRDGTLRPWTATRSSRAESFSTPTPLPLDASFGPGGRTFLTADGLGLYYSLPSESFLNGSDIWYTTRPNLDSGFGASTNLWQLSTAQSEIHVALSADGAELFFIAQGSFGNTLFRARCDGQ
ncbi:MAG TPA: hypothetical protein VFS67_36335 [Polyangiaceae bacterium]|jgi:hypothetical protein|nr:hypothetical protein [Polyangiaceae bacterium]